ncbi:unnamed protein product [Adineta ricciae]|uniref:Uncharacterized protein n=1 Tax=Adineta ricciae TaxID=249248 RepID=A0A816DIJ1_ADIRI|nr:unnamed protein product [Adineta ricciae]
MEFESNVGIQSLRLTPKHSVLVRKADQSQGKCLFADKAKIGDYLYLMKNSSHPVVEMVTNAILKILDGYSFRRIGHQYECPFCRDFSINVLKMLFVHMEKFHTKEFLDMVQQRRDALNVLDEAIMNIPDEADGELPDHFVLSSSSVESKISSNVHNKDILFKSSIDKLYLDFQQGRISSDQFADAVKQLQIDLLK